MTQNLIRIACMIAIVCGNSTVFLVGQEPTDQIIEVFADRLEVSAQDVPERLTQVDAAIRCKIVDSQVSTIAKKASIGMASVPEDLPPDVFTESTVTLLEIFKGNTQLPAVGQTLRIIQPFGTTTWKGRRVVKRDGTAKPFAPGEEYVLFMMWNPNMNEFFVISDDTFQLRNDRVESPSSSQYGAVSKLLSAPEFVGLVRAAAKSKR